LEWWSILIATFIIAGFAVGSTFLQSSGKGTLTIQIIMDKPMELEHLNMAVEWMNPESRRKLAQLNVDN
jgi:hypothetical protein